MISYKHVAGGGVPGGHNVLYDGKRSPFITPMKECQSIELRHSDVVVDIGAYVGTYAIRAARFPVKKVIAYEPTPETFEVLSLTKLPNLELHSAAVVGDGCSSIKLFISSGIGVTNSTVLSYRKARAVTVQAVQYEEAVADASIVKIDIEGGEYGLPIVQPTLRAIIIDFHKIPGDWLMMAGRIIANFEAAGFKAVISPNWSCGWTCAGSWLRPIATSGQCDDLMSGQFCCGCGSKILASRRALCSDCWHSWSKKHRDGYMQAVNSI